MANKSKHGWCPKCGSAQIMPKRDKWMCRRSYCCAVFDEPVKQPHKTEHALITKFKPKDKTGMPIAGLSYRHQICREILQANELAKSKHNGSR